MFFKKKHIASEKPDVRTHAGFETLYNLYSRNMYALAVHKIHDKEAAREMVQNIFKSLWERKEELELNGNWENYLMRATKLEIIDYTRARERQNKHLECMFSEQCESDQCTENEIFFNEMQQRVHILVDQLPCQCRNVFKMSREEGLNNKEIASRLLISERAVQYHINHAVSFLKKNIEVNA